MQPPFDLNLMMTAENRDPRVLIAEAEAARKLRRAETVRPRRRPRLRELVAMFGKPTRRAAGAGTSSPA